MREARISERPGPFVLGLLVCAAVLLLAPDAGADAAGCRSRIAKVAGSFAKGRAKLIARCEDQARCDVGELSAKLAKLQAKSERKLAAACNNLPNGELGLGQTCPDPSGRCTQVLDSDQALIDCVLCMVRETVDPLIRRLRGDHADVAETCGGCSATPCEEAFFCETPRGHCDVSTIVGVCLEVPTACPEILDPVCGCNGVTYLNNCLRRQARVALFHEGPCVTFCDGDSGSACPEGTTCAALPGHCDDTSDEGICVPIPDDCTEHHLPLCGCDGVTYANECALLEAGVRLDHFGPCEHPCTNDGSHPCGEGTFCELPPEVCDHPEGEGICLPRPEACPQHYEPVCGCDGATYGNNCERMGAGVALLHHGECRELCGGILGEMCNEGKFCDLPAGLCEGADLQGHCVPVPEICPELFEFEAVCGCNGETYPSNCERLRAGVQLAHFGPCFEPCEPGNPGACGEAEICLTPPGHCELTHEAMCVPLPPECPLETGPVCGCDGITYDNLCQMIQAGVSLLDDAPCEVSSGCLEHADCGEGAACLTPPGYCDLMHEAGCVPLPEACPAEAFAVCGCDGITYPSHCHAVQERASIAHEGPC
jgi:hypothetical protein